MTGHKRKPPGSKAGPDGSWDMFSSSEFHNLGPLALRPVIRTNQPFVFRRFLCCSWSIYSAQGLWCYPVAISNSQEPTAHLVAKEPEENWFLPQTSLHTTFSEPLSWSRQQKFSNGQDLGVRDECPTAWLSLGQRKIVWLEGMANKVVHFFKKGKQRLIEVKWFAQVHTTDL